jgi:DNA mismatch endonuclease (patch repair protein)
MKQRVAPTAVAAVPSSAEVSGRMQRQASRDTAPEVALRSALHRLGLRYRVHVRPISEVRREADVVFRRVRVAVFVDGCFWHGCPDHASWPKANSAWWRDKIETNRARDRDTDARLAEAGWLALRVWEHEPPQDAAQRIASVIRNRMATPGPAAAAVSTLPGRR